MPRHTSNSRRPTTVSLDGSRWVACHPGFFLPVRVLMCRFRKLYLRYLQQTYAAGKLHFFGELQHLGDAAAWWSRRRLPQERM